MKIDVTFAIASYNSIDFLEDAVSSALTQKNVSVEVLIVDDGSNDGSLELAMSIAKSDKRVRVLKTKKNSGPAGARNLALNTMRGDWYAVLDSDDLIKPERSYKLIAAANKAGADLIADNLEIFGEGINTSTLLKNTTTEAHSRLTIDMYFEKSCLFSKQPGYGFLKPMIRRSVIKTENLKYDERLRIGEDDELIVRLLASGYHYALLNAPMYRYRKHMNSISHRLSLENALKMLETESNIQNLMGSKLSATKAYKKRLSSIKRGVSFVKSINYLKTKNYPQAIRELLLNPSAIPLYRMPIGASLKRLIS